MADDIKDLFTKHGLGAMGSTASSWDDQFVIGAGDTATAGEPEEVVFSYRRGTGVGGPHAGEADKARASGGNLQGKTGRTTYGGGEDQRGPSVKGYPGMAPENLSGSYVQHSTTARPSSTGDPYVVRWYAPEANVVDDETVQIPVSIIAEFDPNALGEGEEP